MTGALDTVQLNVFPLGNPGDLVVSILGTGSLVNPGLPDNNNVLATQVIHQVDVGTSTDNVQTVVFDSPATVQAGTKYALRVSDPDCTAVADRYEWGATQGDAYTAGAACVFTLGAWDCASPFPGLDGIFATYVTAPTAPPSADVAVSISGPTSAKKGAQATYVVTVSNAGPDTAHNVVLSDPVPSGASFLKVTTTKGSCTPPGRAEHTIRCALGDLSAGNNALSSVTLKITAKIGSTIADVATADSTTDGSGAATPDPQPSNNSASLSTTVTK